MNTPLGKAREGLTLNHVVHILTNLLGRVQHERVHHRKETRYSKRYTFVLQTT